MQCVLRGLGRCIVAAASFFSLPLVCAFAGVETPHGTGLLPSPNGSVVRRIERKSSAAKALLSSSADADVESSSETGFPVRWDSREKGWASSTVKDQGSFNTCWAFATLETLETQLRRLGLGDCDFSEKHLANMHGYNLSGDAGGLLDFAAAYLMRWEGCVDEDIDAYPTSSWESDSVPHNPSICVHDMVWVPARSSATDNDELKAAITNYGAVAVACYMDSYTSNSSSSGAYYTTTTYSGKGHAVAVIGWDDEYSATNFPSPPSGDGAWLVKNSWGEDLGSNGFFYVSYYDKHFCMGSSSYGNANGVVLLPAATNDDYTAVYGYDRLGPLWYGSDLTKKNGDAVAAVFTASPNEELAAAGLYSCAYPLDYTLNIYTNLVVSDGVVSSPVTKWDAAYSQTGCIDHAGFSTIRLDSPVPLVDGEVYSVVFETEDATDYFAVYKTWATYATNAPLENKTFYRTNNSWRDSSANGLGNICLKAYTRPLVAARDGDTPGEGEDGASFLAALSQTNATLYAQASQTFGAVANCVGANGRSLWANWLLGLDPSDASLSDLELSITLTNGLPYLAVKPYLGDERTYTFWGKTNIDENAWTQFDDPASSGAHFFRVAVGL